MALGEVCPRRWEKGEKEANFGLFPVCRGRETRINAAHSGEKWKKRRRRGGFRANIAAEVCPRPLGAAPRPKEACSVVLLSPLDPRNPQTFLFFLLTLLTMESLPLFIFLWEKHYSTTPVGTFSIE
jgi:hypothetical protein